MHESGLVAEVVAVAVARAGGRAVELVRVRRASTVPEEALRGWFEMLTADGPLASAALEAEAFDVPLECPCGFDGPLAHGDMVGPGQAICPACGELRGFPPVSQLELVEIRLAD